MLKSFFCCCLLFAFIGGRTQTGSWEIVSLKDVINDKWSVTAEGQMRSWKIEHDLYYYELKLAAGYNLNKSIAVAGGFGTFHTYVTDGEFKKPLTGKELRTWLQLTMFQTAGWLRIDHRYRAEQRFTSTGYRNRFRYRLNAILPVNRKTLTDHTLYAMAYDELFFTGKPPYFERNRLFGGMGYQANQHTTLQAGYLDQFDYSLAGHLVKGFVQVSALFTIHLKNIIRAQHRQEGVD